jgi:hypothetical protein
MISTKKIRALIVTRKLVDEVFEIVVKAYPEIISKAMIQVVDKNPEFFKAIFEEMREKHNAEVQEEDNPTDGL